LYLDVAQPDTIEVPGIGFALPGPILILAAITQFLSAKIMQPFSEKEKKVAEETKGAADDMQVAMQQSMVFTFPLITLLVGVRFPSGLALYWLIFSLTQAYQQYNAQGWGGLTPWIKKFPLIKLQKGNKK
jgi:YidC/Oxa1 family membrane protein insertase